MSILQRILGLPQPVDTDLEERAERTKAELIEARQEYRQTVQRLESGVRVMQTWNGAMSMLSRGDK